jgi:hypothetical protein
MDSSAAAPTHKRQCVERSEASDATVATMLPPPGEESRAFLEDVGLVLRHGTSLALMASASAFLSASDDFEAVDPEADWDKWTKRRPGLRLYYVTLEDPSRDGDDAVSCALRAVFDGIADDTAEAADGITDDTAEASEGIADDTAEASDGIADIDTADAADGGAPPPAAGGGAPSTPSPTATPSPPQRRRRRLVIDYVYTAERARGKVMLCRCVVDSPRARRAVVAFPTDRSIPLGVLGGGEEGVLGGGEEEAARAILDWSTICR